MDTYTFDSVQEANKTLNALLDLIVEGTWDWHAQTGHVDRSPGWYRMLGYELDSFSKDVFTWENIIHPEDHRRVMNHFELYVTGKIERYEVEYRCKRADGSYLWIIDRGCIIERHSDGSVARMIGAHENIHERKIAQSELLKKNQLLQAGNLSLEKLLEDKNSELQTKNRELEQKIAEVAYLSITDTLTQIANRRYFELEIEKELSRARRYNHALSFAIFDIDFFKVINDQHGHKVGDEVLKALVMLVKSHLRGHDFIARWGGEEFAVVLPDTTLEAGVEACEKLRQLISEMAFDNDIFITCSFGVTQYNEGESLDTLFIRADNALLSAKSTGRNKVVAL